MKKYYKNGQQVQIPTSIVYKGCTYVHPTDFILTKAGYEIVEEESPVYKVTNEDIKIQRSIAYKHRADEYFIAYQAYMNLDELDKAKEMKALWLEERKKIDEEYPYIKE